VRARGHFPNETAALKCVYLTVRSLDPTGTGRQRWKQPLNAFAVAFEDRILNATKPVSWVGPQRPVGVAPDGFLRPARRTRRAPVSAPGSPRVLTAFSMGLLLLAWVPKGSRCCRRGSGSGSRRRWMRR